MKAQQNFIKVPAKLDDTNLRGFVPISTDKVIGLTSPSGTTLRIYYTFRTDTGKCLGVTLTYSSGVTAQDVENLKNLIVEQSQNPGNVKTFRLVADVDHDATYAMRFSTVQSVSLSEI